MRGIIGGSRPLAALQSVRLSNLFALFAKRGLSTILILLFAATGPALANDRSSEDTGRYVETVVTPEQHIADANGEVFSVQLEATLEIPNEDLESVGAHKNDLFDYALVGVRLIVNSTAIAYGLTEFSGIDLPKAIAVGVLGGTMSALFQIFHPQVTKWVTHKGWLRPKLDKKASFFEVFFGKEYSLHAAYLSAIHLLQAAIGLKPSFLSIQPLISGFWSLIGEGPLTVANFKTADRLLSKVDEVLANNSQPPTREQIEAAMRQKKRIWRGSKIAAVLISVVTTFLGVMDMQGVAFAAPILQTLGAAGGVATAYLFREELKRTAKGFLKFLKNPVKGCQALFSRVGSEV